MFHRREGNTFTVAPPSALTAMEREGRRPRAAARLLRVALPSALIACVALLVATAAASAANFDLRGEWSYKETCTPSCPVPEVEGIAMFRTQEENGAFTGTNGAPFPGTLSGTVTEDTMSLTVVVSTPVGQQTFTMPEGTINPATSEFSGSGYYNSGGPSNPTGVLTAKRLRTLQQIEEQEAREKAEREGREKGEKEGRAIGEKKGLEKGEKEGLEKGEKEGLAKGEAEGRAKAEQEAKLKAEQEARERQAKEAQAQGERAAKEKAEKEAAEKANAQAREKIEREAREKVAKEAAERKRAEAKKHKKHKKAKHKPAKKAKASTRAR